MTEAEELKALREEVAALRKEVAELRADRTVHHYHHQVFGPTLPPQPIYDPNRSAPLRPTFYPPWCGVGGVGGGQAIEGQIGWNGCAVTYGPDN